MLIRSLSFFPIWPLVSPQSWTVPVGNNLLQLGIQFVQVGQDEQAAKALEELDDKLKSKHGVRDIVDYTMWPVRKSRPLLSA